MGKSPETSGDGSFHYHYSREARLNKNPRVKAAFYGEEEHCHTLPCFFKRNRGLMYLFIDIIILTVLFGIYFAFFAAPGHTIERDGVRFTLHAFPVEDEVLVSFVVRRIKGEGVQTHTIPLVVRVGNQKWEGEVTFSITHTTEQVVRKVFQETKATEASATFRWIDGQYTISRSIE